MFYAYVPRMPQIDIIQVRYSTFQYPDQDAYQYSYPEDVNVDPLFQVSVFAKRIFLFLPYLNSAYIISLPFTWKLN